MPLTDNMLCSNPELSSYDGNVYLGCDEYNYQITIAGMGLVLTQKQGSSLDLKEGYLENGAWFLPAETMVTISR